MTDRCKWEIVSRNPHQCHESGQCPHLNDPGFQCECIPRAREVEAGIAKHIESGAAERQIAETIKNVRVVV